MPKPYQYPARWNEKFDEFVSLIEIILLLDVVFLVVAVMLESEDGCEVYARTVEWDEPKTENLGDIHIEEEIRFVVRCSRSSAMSLRSHFTSRAYSMHRDAEQEP